MRLKPRRKSREEAHRQMAVEQELERRRSRPRRRAPRLRRPVLPRRPSSDRVATGARAAASDLVGILREVVAWPARLWLAAAEVAGEVVLAVWASVVWP